MIALYIILGLILLITLFLSLNVEIGYKLKDKSFSLYARIGPVRIKLFPAKRKKFNYKKLAKKLRGRKISDIKFTAKEKAKANKLDIKELLSDLRFDSMINEIAKSSKNPELTKILLSAVKEFALKFRTKLHTNIKYLIIKVDEGEASTTCIRVGIISQAVAYIIEFLNIFTNFKPLKKDTVAVIPCFDNSGYSFRIEGSFRLRIISLLTSFISAIFKSMTVTTNENNNVQIRKDIKQ